ncbi:MAG: glycosyltransferase family 39 protein, partial [Chthoniobacterales bacterium]
MSRVPFLSAGYGENVDAWRVARAARQIAQTHVYEVSRFPGYPVHEITCAFVRSFGAVGLNALSAVFSVAAVIAAWLVARRLECRDAFLLALALAATPVFFLNSVTAKDYVWAIAFVLWAFYAALERRPILCGVLLGLAIGCRITSGAMIVPLAMVLYGAAERKPWRTVIIPLGLCAGFTAALMFLPVWIRYGREFFTFYDAHDRPDAATILLRGSTEVWGAVGLAGLAIVLGGAI